MKKKFILLTTTEDKPIIIGVSNISLIEIGEDENSTSIMLNFARNKDLWPKRVLVKESFDKIKSILEL